MVSILPSGTPGSIIGADIGRALQSVLPNALNQGYQRGLGLNAIDQLQNALSTSNGDISKILPELAKAYTLNPNLERSGLGQFAMQQAKVNRAFGEPQSSSISPQTQQQSNIKPATASPFNIPTTEDIDAAATEYARALNDPAAYDTEVARLQNKAAYASKLRSDLEQAAKKVGVPDVELPRFLEAGQEFDTRNPSQWAQKTFRKYNELKNADNRLERHFIPGIGSGLLGRNREEYLKRLDPDVKALVDSGREQEVRQFLTDNYLTPTEVEERIHPLNEENRKEIKKLPRGLFPFDKSRKSWEDISKDQTTRNPFKSYEEILEKDPKAIEILNENLTDFFENNVTPETSLLALRDSIMKERDYDWRQINDAVRNAQARGLKLEPFQEAELASIAQPPIDSLPHIFQSFDRFWKYLQGNK